MPPRSSTYRLSDIAARFDLELHGDGDKTITGVGTLRHAGADKITFLANPAYRKDLPGTRAGVVVLQQDDSADCPVDFLVAADPYLAYARIACLFDHPASMVTGIHPSAVIDPSARLGAHLSIGPRAVIGPDCAIGDRCSIGPGSVIGAGSALGCGCQLHAHVTLAHGVRIGDRVIVHSGAVIGADGFGIAWAGDHWQKVPQLGGVVIGNDCEIGANTTIDRGAIGDTVLEEDVRIDNQVQVAHNVFIGAHTAIAAMVGISGSTRIGRYCLLGAGAGLQGHIEIADRVTIGAKSVAYYSIDQPGTTWSCLIPAQPLKAWQRNLSRLRKLDQLARRLGLIEKRTGKQEHNDQ